MTEAAQSTLIGRWIVRRRIERLADGLAVAVAVSLPWSTTASGILVALWLVALAPTLDLPTLRRAFAIPAAAFPAALCLLALAGMLWTDVALAERFSAFKVFLRLLCIGLLLIQFQRSERGKWVLVGFLASCIALLIVSWLHWFMQPASWRPEQFGIPVKDYVIQSGEFLICAFAAMHLSLDSWKKGRRPLALALVALAALFLANIVYVATGRSTLVMFGALVVLFGFQRFGWKGGLVMLLTGTSISAAAWMSSPFLRMRVIDAVQEYRQYRPGGSDTSVGFRLDAWRHSVGIVATAPLIGHGTGALREQFRAVTRKDGAPPNETDNPHNQTFVVAIQLGLVGVALLYGAWLSHLLLFRGGSLIAMLGAGLVVHNVVAGIFNTYLFEFTLGWIYVFGVGVLGGMMLRAKARKPPDESIQE